MTESSIISTMFIYFDIDVLKEALIIYTINHLQQVEGMFICIQGRLWCTNWQGVFKVYVLYNQVKNTHFCNKNKLKKKHPTTTTTTTITKLTMLEIDRYSLCIIR